MRNVEFREIIWLLLTSHTNAEISIRMHNIPKSRQNVSKTHFCSQRLLLFGYESEYTAKRSYTKIRQQLIILKTIKIIILEKMFEKKPERFRHYVIVIFNIMSNTFGFLLF